MSTIPASTVVQVLPGVIAAGGASLNLNGLMLTSSTRVPIGTVAQFASPAAVANFFGGTSIEAEFADVYFNGFDNSTVKPGNLLVAQYNQAAVPAYLRGGNFAATNGLQQIQGFNGTLSVTIDGLLKTANINLAGATSFTNAAEIIAGALGIVGLQNAAFTGSIVGTTLTITEFTAGQFTMQAANVIGGAGVAAGTFIVQQLTSTEAGGALGGAGTYQVSVNQAVASEQLTSDVPAVQFDSVSGAFIVLSGTAGADSTITFGSGALATSLLLTAATGAVLSQGAAAATPNAFMTNIANTIRNWASFFLTFNPDLPGQIMQRLAFSLWASQQNNRFVYAATDSDPLPATEDPAPTSLADQIIALGYSATNVNWQPSETFIAAFISGSIASINFNQPGGRITFNGRQQSGLTPGVTDPTTAANLKANGYNFYGALATANQQFNFYEFGSVSGPFTWLDSLVNAIAITNAFQLSLMTLLQTVNSIPYNSAGKAIIEQALAPNIQQFLTFGAYAAGVSLSGSQAAAVNAAAGGIDVASVLTLQGWYLFIGDATPDVRQKRGSPPITFFYTDGEAVHSINVASIVLL